MLLVLSVFLERRDYQLVFERLILLHYILESLNPFIVF